MVIPPQFYEAAEFSEGLALVGLPMGGRGYVNTRGHMTLTFPIDNGISDGAPFSEGVAAVRRETDGKWGFMDRRGKIVVEPRFSQVRSFSNGLAEVWEEEPGRSGYIDNTGAYVWRLQE